MDKFIEEKEEIIYKVLDVIEITEITDILINKIVEFDHEIYLFDYFNFDTWASILKNHDKYYKQIIMDNNNIIGLVVVSKNISENNLENEYYYIYT